MSQFKPKFSDYRVVLSNYNGDLWSAETQAAFETFVRNGGGFVVVHAADNAFRNWKEYNRMIGIGGWEGRNEKDGPYVRWINGNVVRDPSPGRGGSHGAQHEFLIEIREPDHPITRGLPSKWLHVTDELYDRLRGPAENLTVLATAHANPAKGGSGFHEPQYLTIAYGQGRVFHVAPGHGPEAMKGVGFIVMLQRGTEWAATGKVTQKVPADFPAATEAKKRN
jgi:type 1 glutamine amidotransferase